MVETLPIVEAMINAAANIENDHIVKAMCGNTILLIAVKHGSFEASKMLLKNGANAQATK